MHLNSKKNKLKYYGKKKNMCLKEVVFLTWDNVMTVSTQSKKDLQFYARDCFHTELRPIFPKLIKFTIALLY